MLRFYYNKAFKYTNRRIIDLTDYLYREIDYANIDSPDTINGHIIYTLAVGENIPTYVYDTETLRKYFVSGITQLRTGKFQISLLRDIISEEPMLWKTEQAYINAGVANDFNSYKRWDLPYTNTKLREERFNINGKSSFFVYYVNTQNISDTGVLTENDLKISSLSVPGVTGFDYEVNGIESIPEYNLIGIGDIAQWTRSRGQVNTIMDFSHPSSTPVFNKMVQTTWTYDSLESQNNGLNITSQNNSSSESLVINTNGFSVLDNVNNSRLNFKNIISSFLNDYEKGLGSYLNSTQINNIAPYVNKIIHDSSDNKVYRLNLSTNSITLNTKLNNTQTSELLASIRGISWPQTSYTSMPNYYQFGNWFTVQSTKQVYNYTLEYLGTATGFDFTFKSNVRKLPKSAVRCVNIVSDDNILDSDIAQCLMLAQANSINLNNDTGKILDIQYLPFKIAKSTDVNIKINNTAITAQFLDGDDFNFDTDMADLTNINKETDTIKIVSPSRANQFMFRPYNNNGSMLFNTKITIKPYSTVIYIRPSTQGLLIADWNDKDCLIINEDFSLTNVTSDWAQYIYQNRNYQNTFDRTIQGREFERTWERRIEDAQRISDDWTSRNISSQKAQTYTGNLPLISGIAGALGTAWQDAGYMQSAQLDREYNESLYQESLNIAKDQFNYQLDNIKSQPTIPSKITTIDIKLLDGVYLEFYSTNETELTAINNYYKYNGNRVDSYGSFQQYWGWFVRGKIIISENYTQPEVDELNRRLNLGIFTEVEYD